MENIVFQIDGVFKAITFAKGNKITFGSATATDFAYILGEHSSIDISSSDEVTIIFAVKGKLIGAAKLNEKEIEDGSFAAKLAEVMSTNEINPKDMFIYFAPSLTFFDYVVDMSKIKKLCEEGKRVGTRGTLDQLFEDYIALAIQCLRKISIPFENIHISDFDTFDCHEGLNSKKRGDKKENVTVATLL